MKKIDTSKLSADECWSVQINGLIFCEDCKFTGLTACRGKEIRKTGKNKKGYTIGKYGMEV
jgi:hypothetical protein